MKQTNFNNKKISSKNNLDKLFELIKQNKDITKDFLDHRNQPLFNNKKQI